MTDDTTTHAAHPEPATPAIEAVAEMVAPTPEPGPAPDPVPVAADKPARTHTGTPIWLTLVLVAAVAAEPLVLGRFAPGVLTPSGAEPQAADPQLAGRLASLEQALAASQARLAKLEARPSATSAGGADLAPLTARVAALETAQPGAAKSDTSVLEARIAALESRPAASMPDVTSKVDTATHDLEARIAELDGKVRQQMQAEAAQIALTARLRAATLALEAGQPIGAVPGAPAELARFATQAPPTESALRLSFAKYADAGEAASQPSGGDSLSRAVQRLEGLVTIRQGHDVLVGNTAAAVIEEARGRLEAGDLAGCVAELATLDAGAKAAMKPWLDQAQALVAARAALVALAAKS